MKKGEGIIWSGKTEEFGEKPLSVPLCSPKLMD
jgi:hypothetical protein